MEQIPDEEAKALMFINLSKQLIDKGDLEHAERLLKGGLLRAEKKKDEAEGALKDIKKELLKIYKLQGKTEEYEKLKGHLGES